MRRRRLAGGFLLVLLPIAKWLQVSGVEQWRHADALRQLLLCLVLVVAVRVLCGSWKPLFPWQSGRRLRTLLWTVGPAIALAAVIVALGSILGFEDYLRGGQQLLLGGTAGRVLFLAVVIGFGEEYLFRGLLFAIVAATGLDRGGFWLLSLSFAAWHIPDALPDGAIFVVGTLTTMFAVSHLVLVPLRRVSGNVVAPALLHAVNNVGLSFIAF